jgi:hypothetical protein
MGKGKDNLKSTSCRFQVLWNEIYFIPLYPRAILRLLPRILRVDCLKRIVWLLILYDDLEWTTN